jgi:hypothetical protein
MSQTSGALLSAGVSEDWSVGLVLGSGVEMLESAESLEVVELEHPISEKANAPANKIAVKLRKIEVDFFILVLSFP